MNGLIVGIGCDQAQELPADVLSQSIKSHAGVLSLRILKLHQVEAWPALADAMKKRQRTPFSFQRFLLARQVLDGQAEAGVYLDSDMLVLRPIDGLMDAFRSVGSDVATIRCLPEWRRAAQSSVMVMNRTGASRLWESYQRFLEGALPYDDLIYLKTIPAVGELSHGWNGLEYLDEESSLIHYTDMDTQPWLRDGNPNAGIWYAHLWRFTQTDEGRMCLQDEIRLRHVRPALKDIATTGPSISSFSTWAKLRDIWFIPPHRFRRIRPRWLRTVLAPLLRSLIAAHFMVSNGQPNRR